MMDYGEFVPQALRSSQDKYYRTLGDKLDMYEIEDNIAYATLNGTHGYINSYTYTLIFFWEVYQASDNCPYYLT